MDQRLKVAIAAGVLAAGMAVACLFRHEPATGDAPAVSKHNGRLVLRKQAASPASDPSTSPQQPGGIRLTGPAAAAADPAGRPTTVAGAINADPPPPTLARDYPCSGVSGTARWPAPLDMMPRRTTMADDSPRTHKIVDGDTLEALAERYLGSAARSAEIYEANRDVLPSPQLLPIATQLKIPPRRNQSTSPFSSGTIRKRPVVPVER